MSEIPQPEADYNDIKNWFATAKMLAALKQKEHFLRLKVFNGFFPAPKEGTNNYVMPDHYTLKGKYNINRNVDEAALNALTAEFLESGLHVDDLFKFKPELKKAEYNKLTDEQRHMVDRVLIIKPGSPALEISLSAAGKKKIEAEQK